MNLEIVTDQDLARIQDWIDQDTSKIHKQPAEWLTGNGQLAFRHDDLRGPVCYVRVDKENELLRLYYLFAPESEVSKSRNAKAILMTLGMLIDYAKHLGLKGLIYDSKSEKLIQFVHVAFGFVPAGEDNYKLEWE